MENIIKKRSLALDPQYFGAFLNMARHNVFTINNHLVEKLQLKTTLKLPDDENVPNSFIGNEIKENPNLIFTQLVRFLPIAKVYSPEMLPKDEREINKKEGLQLKSMANDFNICLRELNKFRNDYTHYYSITNGTNRKTTIDENLSVFLRANYIRAIEYTKKRFTGVFTDSDFNIAEKDIELVKDSNEITERGLVFFTCMFLEREYAFRFINRIVGFKNTTTKKFKATREVFSAFCVNLPHDKFISDDPKQAFVLDMLNELNKCPDELYKNITVDEKKQFQPDIKDVKINIEENSIPEEVPYEDYDEYVQSITVKKRGRDRFPYFALKYLDMNSFGFLFQLNLGKVFIGDKNTEDVKVFNNIKNVENEKDAKAIIDVRKAVKFSQFNPHFHDEKNKIGIASEKAREYVISYVKNKDNQWISKVSSQVPDAFLSIHELPKVVLIELLEKGKAEQLIKSFLKTNKENILNSEFIEKIKKELNFGKPFNKSYQKKKESAYSAKGLEILAGRKAKLNKILEQYNLDDRQIPGRILDYWLDINPVDEEVAVANRIKAMKKDCIDRLKAKGKRKAPKIGEMATYLARDIVGMIIDENVKKKINAFYYDKMQECLALYADPEKKQLFIELCGKELNLFDKEKGQPFLRDLEIQKINKTSDFYEKYLMKKGKDETEKKNREGKNYKIETNWLYTTFYNRNKNPETGKWETKITMPPDLSKIPFSIRNLKEKEKSNLDQWLDNVLKGNKENDKPKPVDLPTNLFDDTLVSVLREKLKAQKIPFNEGDIFSKLFDLWCNDIQPFYNAEREYRVYEEPVRFRLGTKNRYKEHFKEVLNKVFLKKDEERNEERKTNRHLPPIQKSDILGVFNDAITENEKLLRFEQTKDRVLLMMVNQLGGLNVKLKDIYPLSEKSPLSHQVDISQKVEGLLSYDTEGNHLRIKDRMVKISKIIKDKRKRKDYTVFRKFISDKRLPELFEYFKEDTIEHEKLKKELEEYNKYKEFVFDKVFALEKTIIVKPGTKEIIIEFAERKAKGKTVEHIQHEPYLEWLKTENIINESLQSFLEVVRNSFSHSQFPSKKVVEKFIEPKEEDIASRIFDKYSEEIDKVIEKISSS